MVLDHQYGGGDQLVVGHHVRVAAAVAGQLAGLLVFAPVGWVAEVVAAALCSVEPYFGRREDGLGLGFVPRAVQFLAPRVGQGLGVLCDGGGLWGALVLDPPVVDVFPVLSLVLPGESFS